MPRMVRDVCVVLAAAMVAAVAGFWLTVGLWASSAAGAGCVGAWRVGQWETALNAPGGVLWEPARPGLVDEPLCDAERGIVEQAPPFPPALVEHPPTLPPAPFLPDVEQWRPLVGEVWAAHPHGINDALLVVSRESAGCATAAAYRGCVGEYLPRQNPSGCQARGLFQHCQKYWAERTAKYGLPAECHPLEAAVDPRCNVQLAYLMWLGSGCSFYPHWAQTDHGTARGCE